MAANNPIGERMSALQDARRERDEAQARAALAEGRLWRWGAVALCVVVVLALGWAGDRAGLGELLAALLGG